MTQISDLTSNNRWLMGTALASLIAAGALTINPSPVFAAQQASWNPTASERLVKLPGQYLKKSIDNDFSKSGLANELARKDEQIELKRQSLGDLQKAVERADGELKADLRHQFLAEKQAFISLMKDQQDLQRRQARTKARLYSDILRKLERNKGAQTPQRAALVKQQDAARQRFAAVQTAVDAKLFESSLAPESRYAREYASNVAAIENLVAAINNHPMNKSTQIDGQEMNKADYLRHLIAESESDLAIIDQERNILGYMAKLVSLDALALSDASFEAPEGQTAANTDRKKPLFSAIDYFVNR